MRMHPVCMFAMAAIFVGCSGGSPESPDELIVYSGRSESLIGPLLDQFTERTGVQMRVRYGGTAELAATLMEEGSATPADVFISQDAAALGALSDMDVLRRLPQDLLDRVPRRFRSAGGDWVGLSGRARVVVYNTERVTEDQLPQSLDEIADPQFRGRIGLAPTNASFQAHMALYLAQNGEEALRELLAAMTTVEPMRYPKNSPIVEAVIAGEIDWGLVNHYYLWRALRENPDAPARNFFMPGADVSSFVNVAGAGVLSDNDRALELLAFLLEPNAQRYFAEQTYEYPLVDGVAPAIDLPGLDQVARLEVDYGDVAASLERTLELIDESGLNRF